MGDAADDLFDYMEWLENDPKSFCEKHRIWFPTHNGLCPKCEEELDEIKTDNDWWRW